MTDIERDRVARAIWPWREARRKRLAGAGVWPRALIQCAIMAAVAAWMIFRIRNPWAGFLMLAFAVALLVCGLAAPAAFRAVDAAVKRIGALLAAGVAWLALVPFYYLCFVPRRVIMALSHKDHLNLEFPGNKESFWAPYKGREGMERYGKQY